MWCMCSLGLSTNVTLLGLPVASATAASTSFTVVSSSLPMLSTSPATVPAGRKADTTTERTTSSTNVNCLFCVPSPSMRTPLPPPAACRRQGGGAGWDGHPEWLRRQAEESRAVRSAAPLLVPLCLRRHAWLRSAPLRPVTHRGNGLRDQV